MKNDIIKMVKDINPYVDINEESNLFEEDILDSVGLLVLITELEERYNIKIPLDNLKADNFEYIDNIIKFVNECRSS